VTTTAQFTGEMRTGRFVRQPNHFRDRVTADGSSGFAARPGRYHLYVSYACPWAHRQLIVRALRGLEDVVSVTVVDPVRDERGWRMTYEPDEVNGFSFLSEAYLASDPQFRGRYTVPALWDREAGRIVTNDYPVVDVQLNGEFDAYATRPGPDLYPADLRAEVDALDEAIYHDVNNGVYKAGFATTQEAYEDAYAALFAQLDLLEERLADRRYLCGDRLTLADVRLFTTLVRFDAVYHDHFRCNRNKLAEMPVLWAYARDLYQTPGFGSTTRFDHIKDHYYRTHHRLNPSGIVPAGPALDWEAPHGRHRLGPAAVTG
jgi:putative glutathione S-transferase